MLELPLELELGLALARDRFIPHGTCIVPPGGKGRELSHAGLEACGGGGGPARFLIWRFRRSKCALEHRYKGTLESRGSRASTAGPKSAAAAGYQSVGFGFPRFVLPVTAVSLPASLPALCVCVCVCASGRQCKGPGVGWAPWAVGDVSPAALVPNLAQPPTPATPGAAPHCSTELVNDLSLARAAASTVVYPTHTAGCCYPAALPPWPGPVPRGCTHRRSRTHARQLVPLGGWREAKGVFMHRRPLQYIRPPGTFRPPSRKTPDGRLLSRGPPSSVSLCRSISASLLLRDHVCSTLQTPSRAPSSQRTPAPDSQPGPSATTDAVPTLPAAQLPAQPPDPTASSPRPHAPIAITSPLRLLQARRLPGAAVDLPPDREGSPIPVLPRRGHAALNMRKRETHPYVSQHNER